MLLSLLTPLIIEGPAPPQPDTTSEYSRSFPTNLLSAHTPSPHSNQGSRAPSSGPAQGTLKRSESPRRKYPPGRPRRSTTTRRPSRGSGSSHSRATTRSRSVSIDSNSSLKHVGGGALDDESDSSDGDISESELEEMALSKPPTSGASALSLVRPFASPLSRRIRSMDLASASRLATPNEADEHNLSLMGGGSSDEHLPTDTEPLHNSPTSEPEISEPESEGNVIPSTTSLATLKPDISGSRIDLRRQDSRSSIGTAKPSLHLDDPSVGRSIQHKKERSGDSVNASRISPSASRAHSLQAHRRRVTDPAQGMQARGANQTIFHDRGRSRIPRRDVNEAEEKYRQMGWQAMRETIAYYSERVPDFSTYFVVNLA